VLVIGPSARDQLFGNLNNNAGLFLQLGLLVHFLRLLQLFQFFLESDGELEPLGVHLVLGCLADLFVEVEDCPGEVIELLSGEGLGLRDALENLEDAFAVLFAPPPQHPHVVINFAHHKYQLQINAPIIPSGHRSCIY
jgi:hypothetical protein